MTLLVTVINTQPVVRLGLTEALARAGFNVQHPPDINAWASEHEDAIAVVGVRDGHDVDLVTDLLGSAPRITVVVVAPKVTDGLVVQLLRAGVCGVVSLDADPSDVALTLTAAQERKTVLPTDLVTDMVRRIPTRFAPALREQEVTWLRGLARGLTVRDVADDAGYSEREMFRRLRRLYRRMGVRSRAAALVTAAKWGVLD